MRKNKLNKNKNMLVKTTVITLIIMMLIPMMVVPVIPVSADPDDPADWYMNVNGVLTSDTYSLYPFYEKSIDIGFSKFGEMISYDFDSGVGVGVQYPGWESVGTHVQTLAKDSADIFCNELISTNLWMNGWFIDIKYPTAVGGHKEIWAFAQFSDTEGIGKDWIQMPHVDQYDVARPLWQEYGPFANPEAEAYNPDLGNDYKGGRKTNGWAYTHPIQVLYDGPRKFIALLVTNIGESELEPLVDIHFTIIFDKVEKYVLILKDVKRTYGKPFPINIQFGNRGEWDMISGAYVHFYTDEPVQWWDLDGDGNINETEMELSSEFFRQWMLNEKYPKKWWQDVDKSDWPEFVLGEPVDVEDPPEGPHVIDMKEDWLETQYTCLTDEWHIDKTIKDHGYAVAQIIGSDEKRVAALAVWPHPEFWSVQNSIVHDGIEIPLMLRPISRLLNWHKWTVTNDGQDRLDDRSNVWVKVDDMGMGLFEPSVPFIIYEHDFELRLETAEQYRIVSLYAVTDFHDADDADMGFGHVNRIDREIQYILDEVFKPWDLRKAITTDTKRWVEYFDGVDREEWLCPEEIMLCGLNCYELKCEEQVEYGLWVPTLPVVCGDEWCCGNGIKLTGGEPCDGFDTCWDDYCSESERVELDLEGDGVWDYVLTPADVLDVDWFTGKVLDPFKMWKSKPYFYSIDRCTGAFCIYKVLGSGYIDEIWELDDDAVIKVLWSARHITNMGDVWMEELVMPVENGKTNFPLHHSVYDHEEVFIIPSEPMPIYELMPGDFVLCESNGLITLDKRFIAGWMKEKTDLQAWLYIRGETSEGIRNITKHRNWNEDVGISNNLPYSFHSEYYIGDVAEWIHETIEVWGAFLNETYIPVEVWDNITWRDEFLDDIIARGGIPVDIDEDGMKFEAWGGFVEVDVVWPEWPLLRGEYVIHETDSCDELVLDTESTGADANGEDMIKIVYNVASGRYEWTVVGKDAATVDSVGAALVTAAIKNKRLEIGMAGLDISETEVANMIPWVMRKFGAGMAAMDYHYDYAGGDHRTALKNDWCTNWAISSSKMISVGGPIANLLSYYANDFTQAFYAIPDFAMGSHWSGMVVPATCWSGPIGEDIAGNPHIYASSEDTGYAVIATTKDKNGTVILTVWGHWGRDTFYASKW
jgi:hypothetical protein